MEDGLDAARALLPGVRLETEDRLGGNDRSVVERVRATWPDGAERTLVVKQYVSAGEGWVRESAALAVIPGGVQVPRVVACGSQPPLLIIADLGGGPSVADALLGDDPQAAEELLAAWARAMAQLHSLTRGARAAFRDALDERQGDIAVAESHVPVDLDDAVRVLDRE